MGALRKSGKTELMLHLHSKDELRKTKTRKVCKIPVI